MKIYAQKENLAGKILNLDKFVTEAENIFWKDKIKQTQNSAHAKYILLKHHKTKDNLNVLLHVRQKCQ